MPTPQEREVKQTLLSAPRDGRGCVQEVFDPYKIVQEGMIRGMIRSKRDDIVTVLMERFEAVPQAVVALLNDLEDTTELSRLLRLAARCASLEEFVEQLPLAAAA